MSTRRHEQKASVTGRCWEEDANDGDLITCLPLRQDGDSAFYDSMGHENTGRGTTASSPPAARAGILTRWGKRRPRPASQHRGDSPVIPTLRSPSRKGGVNSAPGTSGFGNKRPAPTGDSAPASPPAGGSPAPSARTPAPATPKTRFRAGGRRAPRCLHPSITCCPRAPERRTEPASAPQGSSRRAPSPLLRHTPDPPPPGSLLSPRHPPCQEVEGSIGSDTAQLGPPPPSPPSPRHITRLSSCNAGSWQPPQQPPLGLHPSGPVLPVFASPAVGTVGPPEPTIPMIHCALVIWNTWCVRKARCALGNVVFTAS
jgi:hypothetical protein